MSDRLDLHPHFDVLHRPMKFWEVVYLFWERPDILSELFEQETLPERYRHAYLHMRRSTDEMPAIEIRNSQIPIDLTREAASKYPVEYDLYVFPDNPDIYLLREHEPDAASRFPSLPTRPDRLTALQVHDRFGGAVMEQIREKGCCNVADRPEESKGAG
jgi:hypothetical protein